ncbi:putative ferric-chelate reductase 1 [Leptodactylus fuscus]|uniref:putative ferric-chelate reductase 1 n=1 Tax=Leptodactylus fuscus TaxID=238119 RepID=UPI003F4EC625
MNTLFQQMDLLLKSITILLTILLFDCTNGYPDGLVEASCTTMEPRHGVNAQTSLSPYSLSLSNSTYIAGQQITVTLSGTPQFTGFLIQARSGSSTTPLGSFKVNGDAQILNCTTFASAASHTSSDSKSSVQVTWVAPANSNSDIRIMATVVKSQSVHWSGIASSKLIYNGSDTSGTNGGYQLSAPLVLVKPY